MICFQIWGVRVELHVFFWGMMTLCVLLDPSGTAVLGIAASVLHELGHLTALALFGMPPRRLSFEWTGICLERGGPPLSPKKEAIVLAAGSFVNFFFAGICLLAGFVGSFYAVHLCLGCLNLMPLEALDGGKLLRLGLESVLSADTAGRVMKVVQGVLLTVVLAGCAAGILGGRLNPTAAIFAGYLLVSFLCAG